MVEITGVTDKCFADLYGGCAILTDNSRCGYRCPFYKPIGCEDWVRLETKNEIFLIPPEELTKERKNEQNL